MKNILILGAAGRTGILLVEQALAAGYNVTAFIRSGDGALPAGVRTIVGDARNEADLKKAVEGQDAVISTLGSSKPGDRVIAKSMQALINVTNEVGVKRVILMASFLSTSNFQPNIIVRTALKVIGSVVRDFQSGENQLKGSNLDYTIVYATRLTNYPLDSNYRIVAESEPVGATDSISRANVAQFLLGQLKDSTYVRKSVLITNK